MPDDYNLSQQDIKDLQEISSKLPAGSDKQKKISMLINSQPTQFEKDRTGQAWGGNESLPEKIAKLTPEQESRRESGMSTAVPTALLTAGPLAVSAIQAPMATLGKLLTSAATGTIGAGLGRWGTRELGGGPEAQEVAATVGGLVGGLAGYREPPRRVGWRGLGFDVPPSLRPGGVAQEAQEALGSFMNRGYKPVETPVDPDVVNIDYERNKRLNAASLRTPTPRAGIGPATGSAPSRIAPISDVPLTPQAQIEIEAAKGPQPTEIDYERNKRLNAASLNTPTPRAGIGPATGSAPSKIVSISETPLTPQAQAEIEAAKGPQPAEIDYAKNQRLNRAAIQRGTGRAFDPIKNGSAVGRGPQVYGGKAATSQLASPGQALTTEAPFSDNLVLSPEEAAAQDRMQQVADQLAKKRGTQYAAGLRPAGPNPTPGIWGPKK